MKSILIYLIFLMSFTTWAQTSSAPTEKSTRDTSVMGGNTPGYNKEFTLDEQKQRQEEVKKEQKNSHPKNDPPKQQSKSF